MLKKIIPLTLMLILASVPAFAITKTPAKDITTDISNFNGNLNSSDTDVQKALQTMNSLPVGSGTVQPGLAGFFPYYPANGTSIVGQNSLYVDANGNIGIGLTNPVYVLEVNGQARFDGSGGVTVDNAGAFRTDSISGHTALLQAYNTGTVGYQTFLTLTAGVSPSMDISTSTTIGGDQFVTLTGTQTVTHKTLTTPIIGALANSGNVQTFFTSTDTFVGRNTTDTLTLKTLTSPKIGTAILDTNGANLFVLNPATSAVNYLTYSNSATGSDPSYAVTGDANRGLILSMAGTGGLTIASTNTGPSTIKRGLTVNNDSNSGTGDDFIAKAGSDANMIHGVAATGNVGIGTGAPNRKLDVVSSDTGTTLTTASAAAIGVTNTDQTNNNHSDLAFITSDAAGTATTGARISGVFTGHTAAAVSGDMTFLTRNTGTNSEKMRLTAGGNLGVGSVNPGATVDVQGNIRASSTIGASNFSGTSSGTNTGDQTITLTGPVTGSGTSSLATAIAALGIQSSGINWENVNGLSPVNSGGINWPNINGLGPIHEGAVTFSNVTTGNASTLSHGFVPILPNDATKYYDGTGNYSVPAGGGGGSSQWTGTAGSPIYYVNNVGIGTALSNSLLGVAGGVTIGTTYAGYTVAPSNGLAVQGNVGIGTSVPAALLNVVGGNVGIGTVSPGAFNLDVGGSMRVGTGGSPTTVSSTGAITSNLPMTITGSGTVLTLSSSSPAISATSSAAASIFTLNGSNSTTGGLSFVSTTNNGTTDSIVFKMGNTGATRALTMQDNSGVVNIGIGTASPSAKLAVVGNIGIGTSGVGDNFTSTAPPNGGMIVEKNVGIGTINPGQMLDVTGNIRQTGAQNCATGVVTAADGTISGCVASDSN